MALETLDDIVEALADHYAVYGAHDEQCGCPDNPQKAKECRCCWTASLKSRIGSSSSNLRLDVWRSEEKMQMGTAMSKRYEINHDKAVPLSVRMREWIWGDGDRGPDWQYNPNAEVFADEVAELEARLASVEHQLAETKRLEMVEKKGIAMPKLPPTSITRKVPKG